MEKRQGYKNYLINGCKSVQNFMYQFPIMKIGMWALFIAAMTGIFSGAITVVSMAIAPLVKFDEAGLVGDNLAFVKDLNKRIANISNDELKALLQDDLKLAVREATKQFALFEKLGEADVAKMKEMLGEDEKGIRSILLKQGDLIKKLELKASNPEQYLDLRGEVKEWQTRHAEIIKKIKNNERADIPKFESRAANSPMLPSNTYTGSTITLNPAQAIREGAPVFDLRRIEPTLWDYLTKGRTNKEMYFWVNKKVPASSGAAAFIGPGVAKPGVSFTFEIEASNAKKIAVSLKAATEMLDDVDGMTSYIQAELSYQLKSKLNDTLMSGAVSSTSPAGVQTFSLPFTTSGLSTTNPNNWDCVRALVAQIRRAYIKSPVVVFMSPIDVANMDMEKAISQGQYMIARQVPGAVIVEDNNIAVGYVQAIAVDLWKNLIYKDFTMTFGWENDDFTKNLVTVVAEMRLHSFHSANDAAGFIYDDLADIKSQIAAA